MYENFFGLNEKPFTITPDPRYLFMSERPGEGLAHLVYGVTESGGFIQLTGEVGTGKTTLVRTLLGQIPAEVDVALILNPELTALEFLTAICQELGIRLPENADSKKALVDALNRHLLDAHSRGRRTILLVDEAQNLSADVLEQLRLLTNRERARQRLVQLSLIAQPELRERLAQQHLRQLAQRVTGRYHLEPLSREEAADYIDHRMRVAGALTEVFEPAAKREVYRLSGGVPRIMNVICDRALLGAYSRELRSINKRLVRKAAAEVSGQAVVPRLLRWLIPAAGIALLLAAGGYWWQSERPVADAVATPVVEVPTTQPEMALVEDVVPAPEPDPAPDLAALLDAHDSTAAYATLLSLWNVPYRVGGGNACDQAAASGLACYVQRGTWTTLRQLDRPVVLELTDEAGRVHNVALTALGEEHAELDLGGERVRLPVDAVADYWFGRFTLVWRPPNGTTTAVGAGMRNETVRWLRQSLAALNQIDVAPAADDDYFDAALESQLVEFQRRHRLEADGLAGQKTQIIINSLLQADGAPRLRAAL